MLALRIEKETYLNLFLSAVAVGRSQHPHFDRYVHLLLNFRAITGKKSADINYVGYKDRTSVLMHACAHGNTDSVNCLLNVNGINPKLTDPARRTALFYAASNPNEACACGIAGLLLDKEPSLVFFR
jgi:ankyrin repeat protein